MNDTKKKLILATERLLQKDGLARVTTRNISQAADVAEGLIYHYFKDKAELIHAVVEEEVHDLRETMDRLPLQVGLRTVEKNLEEVLLMQYDFHYRIVPVISAVFADHKLRERTREILRERRLGPNKAIDIIALYLAAEQRLGRVNESIMPQTAAKLLLAYTFKMAMDDHFLAHKVNSHHIRQAIHEAFQTIRIGLEPRIPEPPQ